MDHAKDHWTLKTGYFEDPNPAIQVQTLPLEGPRSLGYRTNCKKFSTCVLPSCSSQVTKSPLCALKGDHTHLSPVRTPRDPGETRRRRRIQMHRNRWVLPKNVPKKTVRSNKTGGWTNPSEKYKSKFVHLPQSSGWKLKKKWVDWVVFHPLHIPENNSSPRTNQPLRPSFSPSTLPLDALFHIFS